MNTVRRIAKILSGKRPPIAQEDAENRLRAYYSHQSQSLGREPLPDFAAMARHALVEPHAPFSPQSGIRRMRVKGRFRIATVSALSILVAVGLCQATFYVAPRSEALAFAAIANVPGIKRFISPLDSGLLELARGNKIQPLAQSETVNGLRLNVLAAYADSNLTVVFVRAQPVTRHMPANAGTWMESNVVLRDQFGFTYSLSGGSWTGPNNSDGILEFAPVPAWIRAMGVRFHLVVQSMEWAPDSGHGFASVPGPWHINWIQLPGGSGRIVRATSTATASGLTISLQSVSLQPSSAKLHFTVAYQGLNPLTRAIKATNRSPHSKPAPDELYVERLADHTKFQPLSWNTRSSVFGAHQLVGNLLVTPITAPGRYEMVIRRLFGIRGQWVLPFTIP